ncbi:MAG: PHP domain-containing protein [Clostridiales bacterium]|nr:PHP domain-containing protein [Clostridiales bacterium]
MVDLHIHSSASDGSDSIPELLTNLQKADIDTFAVTDHDTIDGAVEMETATRALNLHYIKGIEFSCISPLRKCHLLGYRYDANDPVFLSAIREGNDLRLAKLERRLAFLRETYHVEFTDEELAWLHSQKSPGKPHLADLLLKRGIGKSRDDIIRNYFRGADVDCTKKISPDRFGSNYTDSSPDRMIEESHQKDCDRIAAHTAISGILHAGGIPVWAHPLGGEGERLLTEHEFEEQLQYLIRQGLGGLECHYSRYNEEQVLFLREQAEKHDLLISGGSDYHGTRKTIALGTLNAYRAPVCEKQLTILQKLF